MSLDLTFSPVRSQTAFEETMDRIGTAIKLGVLGPGDRLPAERELCQKLEISRSTLRQALTALVQSGHLVAARGRGGGTFVADRPPPLQAPSLEVLGAWRDACDVRLAVELGVAALAADRADAARIEPLVALVAEMDDMVEDFGEYRQADIRFHIGLAEATGSRRLIALATEAQGSMTDLIAHIAHPPEVLANANAQHARLLQAIRARDGARATSVMAEHVRGTEHVLAGLLPEARPPVH
ncbi:MAG: FadR family transcriptional regulator [Solirubrobacterales bacterium]|jgi:GntR family transcriptional repressor for pyruvate dehydrogenase complex|nr:FadR family transcriptional regulator [Solirubrobacterales bacterium]